jgi:hypothetical protein
VSRLQEFLGEAKVSGAVLLIGGIALLARGSISSRALARAEDRAKELEAQAAAVDQARAQVAELRSSVTITRRDLERQLGAVRPRLDRDGDAVAADVRAICARFAAPATFDPDRDVQALAAREIAGSGAAGVPALELPLQCVVTTRWEQLRPLLTELHGTQALVRIDFASFERGEFPLVNVRLTLVALVRAKGAR